MSSGISPRFKWSFSSLTAFEQCPQMFYLQYIKHVPQEENAFSQYGTFCHGLLEAWAKDEIPDFALAEEYEKRYDENVTSPFPPFPKGMPQKYYDQGLAYFQSFAGFGDQFEILSVEERFEIDIDGYTIVGLADLVLKDRSTGEITVIDHKSKTSATMAKDLPTYRKQLYIYAEYVKQKFGVYPAHLKFNLFRENKWVEEAFSEEMLKETKQWIVDTIESILLEADWCPKVSSFFCRFVCSCFDACPKRDEVLNHPSKEKKKPPS